MVKKLMPYSREDLSEVAAAVEEISQPIEQPLTEEQTNPIKRLEELNKRLKEIRDITEDPNVNWKKKIDAIDERKRINEEIKGIKKSINQSIDPSVGSSDDSLFDKLDDTVKNENNTSASSEAPIEGFEREFDGENFIMKSSMPHVDLPDTTPDQKNSQRSKEPEKSKETQETQRNQNNQSRPKKQESPRTQSPVPAQEKAKTRKQPQTREQQEPNESASAQVTPKVEIPSQAVNQFQSAKKYGFLRRTIDYFKNSFNKRAEERKRKSYEPYRTPSMYYGNQTEQQSQQSQQQQPQQEQQQVQNQGSSGQVQNGTADAINWNLPYGSVDMVSRMYGMMMQMQMQHQMQMQQMQYQMQMQQMQHQYPQISNSNIDGAKLNQTLENLTRELHELKNEVNSLREENERIKKENTELRNELGVRKPSKGENSQSSKKGQEQINESMIRTRGASPKSQELKNINENTKKKGTTTPKTPTMSKGRRK